MMKFIGKDAIEIDKLLSELDRFTIDFTEILKKHSKYVIISGYVSILLGRSRSSEDVDIIIPKMDSNEFTGLLDDIRSNGFYCLNAEKEETIYDYLSNKIAVRFAKEGEVIPNIELKFAKNRIDEITLQRTIKVTCGMHELIISHLELQIAFKEAVLKSQKDIEDARHIREVAKEHLDYDLIDKYKVMLDGF